VSEGLGERIRVWRKGKGWTLKDLSAASELSVPYLSDLERRQGVNPSLDALQAIATALGRSVSDLVGNNGTTSAPPPPSLDRFLRTPEFRNAVETVAKLKGRSVEEVKEEAITFMAAAPRRSSGDLSSTDWRRLLDVFRILAYES